MNIHRYLLPVSIAAAFHVALFLALPDEPWTPFTKIIEVPIGELPPPIPDPVVEPPLEKSETTAPVKTLGGPTPPDMPEPEVLPKPDGIEVPIPDKPLRPKEPTDIIPKIQGPGDPNGALPWNGESRGTITDYRLLDRVPTARVQIAPEYPPAMSRTGTAGFVKIEFDVDTSGRVIAARVVESSHREFEEPALRAVRKWQFEPGKRLGKAVPFRIMVPIEFGVGKD